MNTDRYNRWMMFFYLLIAFLLGMTVAVNFLNTRKVVTRNAHLQKLNEVLNYIDRYYVDSIDVDSIYDVSINAILQNLDPHSSYSSAEDNKVLMESLEGSFEGVGIQFNIMNDTLMVINTVSGGPSEKAGIRAGDRMISVNGESIIGITSEKAYKLLRGKKGTKVKVGIMRPGFKEIYTYEIKRNVIPIYTVDTYFMMNNQTGYIKINEFGSTTVEEFQKAIRKLKSQGMKSMVLDLRGNAGGFLDAAVGVCDELLPNKEKIVSIEGLNVRPEVIRASRRGDFENGKVVVLIDDYSASASEIVAGAVQDNDRGFVVGRRSFGKGLVQRQFELEDNSTIRLTTARYHTPSGRCIQRNYKNGTEAYYEEIVNRLVNGEMENVDSIKLDSTQIFKTVGGRTVYGGGGIMPDYFVPLQYSDTKSSFYAVSNTAALVQYAFHYANDHKAALLKQYPDAKTFCAKMTISDAQVKDLLKYYTNLTKKDAPELNAESKKELKVWMKALIGRNLFGDEAYYKTLNTTDPVVLKALEVLKMK
ncbi:MAG: S41 family peptidase [Bacteroidales bacterium]|nr:S41 family peptidase [Bacteroidales bacterium]